MQTPDLVSVILPTWNRLAYLREAVRSVRVQTWTGWELIVIDDGSDDGTAQYLEQIARCDGRVRTVTVMRGSTIAALRNRGIAEARGVLIAFHDSDDLWMPEKLERQLAALRGTPEARWCYGNARRIDADGTLRPSVDRELRPPRSGWILEHLVRQTTGVTLPSVVAERRLLDEAGGFDQGLEFGEDHDLWFRLAKRAPCLGLADELVAIRTHPGQATRSASDPSSQGMVDVFERFARRTGSPRLRRMARVQQSRYSTHVALRWRAAGRHREALRWLLRAVRADPTGRGIACVLLPSLGTLLRPRRA